MENKNNKTYWPHMILGFLMIGITLGYWTVKHAVQMPVQEVNDYMMKYQQADLGINDILEKKALFDKSYTIDILDAETMLEELENTKRAKEEQVVLLHEGNNTFTYRVSKKDGSLVTDANVAFLLTRPHTRNEDIFIDNIEPSNGKYIIKDVNVPQAGRYTLQLRAKIGEAVGYSQLPAYLKP